MKNIILNNLKKDNLQGFNKLMFSYLKMFEREYLEENLYKEEDFITSCPFSVNNTIPMHSLMYYKEPSEEANPTTGNRVPEETLSFILDHIEGDTYSVKSMIFSSYRKDLKDKILHPELELFYEFSVSIDHSGKKNIEFVFVKDIISKANTSTSIMVMCYTIDKENIHFDIYLLDREGNSFVLSETIKSLNFDRNRLIFRENEITRCPYRLEDFLSEREIAMIEMAML